MLDNYLITPKDRHLRNVDLKLYTKCPLEKKSHNCLKENLAKSDYIYHI
jgi:hypothetical protein